MRALIVVIMITVIFIVPMNVGASNYPPIEGFTEEEVESYVLQCIDDRLERVTSDIAILYIERICINQLKNEYLYVTE